MFRTLAAWTPGTEESPKSLQFPEDQCKVSRSGRNGGPPPKTGALALWSPTRPGSAGPGCLESAPPGRLRTGAADLARPRRNGTTGFEDTRGLEMTDSSTSSGHILGAVNTFYEENPFPGFDLAKYRTRDDLVRQASWWAHKLDGEIPFEADVIDAGCGTGQLACFLGLKGRRILGADYSQHSIAHAESLRDKLRLDTVSFQRENLLELSLPDKSFDYVFCNGVLHHTSNPYRGFRHLVRITRPGGYLVIGLYNTFGRLMLHVRRRVVRLQLKFDPGAKDRALKKQLVRMEKDEDRRDTWWADQYEHPHESYHTVDEVLGWFRRNGVKYVSSYPKADLFTSSDVNKIFKPRNPNGLFGSRAAHTLVQLGWIISQNSGGGYFVMVGQRTD